MATINLPILTIEGIIYNALNIPLPKVIVQVFDKDLRTKQLLGTAKTDKEGKYIIMYNSSKYARAEKETADVFLKVFTDKSLRNEIGQSPVHFNVSSKQVLDIKIDGIPFLGLSEFETLINTIQPLIEGQRVTFQDLKEDEKHQDISFLNAETKIDKLIIFLLPIAFKNNIVTKNNITADIFYGLFRLQFPTKLNELLLIQSESLKAGIEEAIESNIISKKSENEILKIIEKFNFLESNFILEAKEGDKIAFKAMIQATLPTKKLRKIFIDTHLATEANPENFWDKLVAKQGFTAAIIKDTQNVLRLNLLTNEPVLATQLYKKHPELKEIRDYTRLTINDFEIHISTVVTSGAMTTFPNGIEGKTKKQKIENYALFLEKKLGKLFPTDVFKHRMIQDQDHPFGDAKTDLKKFLTKNPDFDLKTTKLNKLFETADFRGIRNKKRVKTELAKINRIHKMGLSYEYTRAILKAGVTSALDIVQMPKVEFVNTICAGGNIKKSTALKIRKDAVLIDNKTIALDEKQS